ncbi:MAG: hypothetical protein JO216_21445 [Hyphomicrobiales bacterium]|nr:hypothetical protein [Hyphomicrobiales bacterium]
MSFGVPFNTSPLNAKRTLSYSARGREIPGYYYNLGRFVDMFARVETAVTLTMWDYTTLDPGIAKILVGRTGIEAASGNIRQLAAVRGLPKYLQDDLTLVLQQLGVIIGVRNALLHYGVTSVVQGKAIVSNALKAKGEPKLFPISPELLDQMYWDLRKILVHLYFRHLKYAPSDKGLVSRIMGAEWQYKHSLMPKSRSKERADS